MAGKYGGAKPGLLVCGLVRSVLVCWAWNVCFSPPALYCSRLQSESPQTHWSLERPITSYQTLILSLKPLVCSSASS